MLARFAPKKGGVLTEVWLLLSILAASLPAAAAVPSVYHTALDDGTPPTRAVKLARNTQTTLHLYIDGGSAGSPEGSCFQGTGD